MSENSQASLDSWLQHIAAVHPREIELGLDRSRRVADRMHLTRPGRYVITVAGTNGKGFLRCLPGSDTATSRLSHRRLHIAPYAQL